MSEREPKRQIREGQETVFDIEAVSAVLQVPAGDQRDVVFGRGFGFKIPASEQSVAGDLELFPGRRAARYRSEAVELHLAKVTSVHAHDKHVRIEASDDQARAVLFLDPTGSLTFSLIPAHSKLDLEPAPVPQLTTPEDMPPAEASSPPEPGPRQEQERLTLIGRVGATPTFRTTPKGILIGRFPLAIRVAQDQTEWHTILSFGSRAAKVQESIKKSDAVEVIGYKHFRETKSRDGKTKMVEEIYAVVVKSR